MNLNFNPNGRFGAAFLVRVGQLETQLYDACLGEENDDNPTSSKGRDKSKQAVLASEGGDRGHLEEKEAVGGGEKLPDAEEEADMEEGRAGLYGMLLVLCSELHKNLRPRVYHGTDMDTLCEVRLFFCGNLGSSLHFCVFFSFYVMILDASTCVPLLFLFMSPERLATWCETWPPWFGRQI